MRASRKGHGQIVKKLVEKGCNTDMQNHVSARSVLSKIEKGEWRKGGRNKGRKRGRKGSVPFSERERALMGSTTSNFHVARQAGYTALSWASALGHQEVVDLLLRKGANPNLQDTVL